MTYDSYEEMLEDQATNPRLIVCPTCEGNVHEGVTGQWRWVKISRWIGEKWVEDEFERWVPCSTCGGSGTLTPRQFDHCE